MKYLNKSLFSLILLTLTLIITCDIRPMARPRFEDAHLYQLVRDRSINLMQAAINNGANVDWINEAEQATPLILAIANCFPDVVEILAQNNADLDKAILNQDCPLIMAITCAMEMPEDTQGYIDIIKILIEHNANNNNQASKNKSTALHYLATNTKDKNVGKVILGTLLERNPDLNLSNHQGAKAIEIAILYKFNYFVKACLNKGFDVHEKNTFGNKLIHLAAGVKNTKMCELLLKYKADLNAQNLKQVTPLHQAACINQPENIIFFINNSANINSPDIDGHTPLHWAVYYISKEACMILLSAPKIDILFKDSITGKPVLEYAKNVYHGLQNQDPKDDINIANLRQIGKMLLTHLAIYTNAGLISQSGIKNININANANAIASNDENNTISLKSLELPQEILELIAHFVFKASYNL